MKKKALIKKWKKEVEKKQEKGDFFRNVEVKIAFILMYVFIVFLFFTTPKYSRTYVSSFGIIAPELFTSITLLGYLVVLAVVPLLLAVYFVRKYKK